MRSLLFALIVAPAAVVADVHRMFVGNLFDLPKSIYTLQFDDQSLELSIIQNTTANTGHSWIALNHDKTALYGVSNQAPKLTTYAVLNGTNLTQLGSFDFDGACSGKNSAFVQGSKHPPYRLYTAGWPGPNGCAASFSPAPETGLVTSTQQSWVYAENAGVHGLDLGVRGDTELIYSADTLGDAIWTHAVDNTTGAITQRGYLAVPGGSHPRHLAAHSTGNYVYVVMEAANTVVSYTVDPATGVPTTQDATYDLLPPDIRAGLNTSANATLQYWSAEVMLSHDGRYLWATARSERQVDNFGYVNGFLLGPDGKMLKQLFQEPTPERRGFANAIAPAPEQLGSEWAAMTDVTPDRRRGGVMMWRMTGRKETELGVEYSGAEVVANLHINDTACCANIAWYD